MNRGFSEWWVAGKAGALGLPPAFLGAPWPGDDLPPEIGLLLPTSGDAAEAETDGAGGVAAFLGDPNLVPAQFARRLLARSVRWVVNLPTVAQHEPEFRRLLAEVDLDHDREMRVLTDLGAAGCATLAAICGPADLPAALAVRPRAVLALPPLTDFLEGFPTLSRRHELEAEIAAATDLPVLGLRAPNEAPGDRPAVLLRPAQVTR